MLFGNSRRFDFMAMNATKCVLGAGLRYRRYRGNILSKQSFQATTLIKRNAISTSCAWNIENKDENHQVQDRFKHVMRKIPLPVVVVTTAKYEADEILKRGITCSSFTSVSFKPPIISFAMNRPSRMHDLLLQTNRFAVHVLAQNQVGHALHFSKPAIEGGDQFAGIEHDTDSEGIPILLDTCAVIQCMKFAVNEVGDHTVWYGRVLHSYRNGMLQQNPLLHYSRGFRSIGDETFAHAFENQTLPFKDWTHQGHLRMAWYYIRDLGKEHATDVIKNGIRKYNVTNKEKISRGYHETVTMFYIHMIADAVERCNHPDITFEEFIAQNNYLTETSLLFQYYSDETVNKKEAYTRFLPPDKKPLP